MIGAAIDGQGEAPRDLPLALLAEAFGWDPEHGLPDGKDGVTVPDDAAAASVAAVALLAENGTGSAVRF